MVDVVVIGAGIVGANMAFLLSKYNLKAVVIEKENDVADGTTKANSAIIHAGYDPAPNTLMAKLNVRGVELTKKLAKDLNVAYKQIGSLVLAFDGAELMTLDELFHRGYANGVPDLRLLNPSEIKEIEPNISEKVIGALYAPSAGVIDPWGMCIALSDTAAVNGVEFMLEAAVNEIEKTENGYKVVTDKGEIEARFVINAAGLSSEKIAYMVGEAGFVTKPSKGEYYLLDKTQGKLVNHVIFQCPNKDGKGVLVSPTVHGNLIVGPNAASIENSEDASTDAQSLEFVRNAALKSVPDINYRDSIRNFAGVRCNTNIDDFIITETQKGFITLGGIKSPGLSAAPAIAEYALEMLKNSGLALNEKENAVTTRKHMVFHNLSNEEKALAVAQNPSYGRVICRCETITEGEIVDAIHSPIVPKTIDAIKRRCGAGMGRCQGGFCSPRVHEILSRELNIAQKDILKDKEGSTIIYGNTKEKGEE